MMFCQDMDAERYLPMYGNHKYLKPEKIKTFVLYKYVASIQLCENQKCNDNFVIAANDTNEISVSFNGRSDCKVFRFDKVLCTDVSQVELQDSLAKSIIQDIVTGLNCFLIVYNLACPHVRPHEYNASFSELSSVQILVQNMLKELLFFAKADENMDSSLHISFFDVHDDKVVDLLNGSEFKDFKILKVPEQDYIEIENVVEKPIDNDGDISELFERWSNFSFCYSNMCHSILTVSLVRRSITCDGFEAIKVGKLTVVDFAKYSNNSLEASVFEDSVLKSSECCEFPFRDKVVDIMRPAFGGNAKTYIIVNLSSELFTPDKDISILQFVAQAQKLSNNPEPNFKLIIPTSLKEYSEEIQELQKDLAAISKDSGVKLSILKYRSYKNSLALENEKVKALNSYQSTLIDSTNAKKQSLISIHAATKQVEQEMKEMELAIEKLKLDKKNIELENNVKQKSSAMADEIIAIKNLRDTYEFNTKKIKSELVKCNRNYDELVCCLDSLKEDIFSMSYDIDTKQASVRSTLDLLITYMNNALPEFQTLHEDLFNKLNNLSDIDIFLKSWKVNAESLQSKLSSFIEEHKRHLDTMKFEICTSLPSTSTSQTEIIEIIQNNRNEKWPILLYHFHKVQIFCDSSFKTLAEIVYQLEMIQNSYKTELRTINSVLFSSCKALKKFENDVSEALKMSQQYFKEQEDNLLQMKELVCFHHEFKKQFDSGFTDLKNYFLALKQKCLSYNTTALSKWNEIQKDCFKISQKNTDLTENLCLIHKQMSSFTENFSQQKLNTIEYPQLKDQIENVEGRTQQLRNVCKEMKSVTKIASELNIKGTDKELLEVEESINPQKSIEKHFNNLSSVMKTDSSCFFDDLKSIQNHFSSAKDDLKNNLDFLYTSISSLTEVYKNYESLSCNFLKKSDEDLTFPPVLNVDANEDILDYECIIFDEKAISSSTPNVNEKRIVNKAYEKEKIFSRIKSLVEQQMPQNLAVCDLGSEEKDQKNQNISTMSLPSLSTQPKACQVMGKKYRKKLKFTKKQN